MYYSNQIKEATWKRRRSTAKSLAEEYGDVFFHNFSRDRAESFVDALANYREYRRVSLQDLFCYARDFKKALAPGATVVDQIRKGAFKPMKALKEDTKIDHHRAAEVAKLFTAALAKEHLRKWIPVMVLWFFGGIHFAEIMRMRYKNISLRGFINVTKFISDRNHCPRPVKLSPAALSWIVGILRELKEKNQLHHHIVPGLDPDDNVNVKYGVLHREWRKAFKEMCNDANVKLTKNGLRHSYATALFHMTNNVKLLRNQMGSHFIDLFSHYVEMDYPQYEAASYFCIGHPDAGPFDPSKHWLPDKQYMTLDDALTDFEDLQEEANAKRGLNK